MNTAYVLVLALVGLSAFVDSRTRRIPNLLTFGGALIAALYHLLTSGPAGVWPSAVGWAVGIALFLPMYLVRGMGAGDVKLLGAVGAWVGPAGVLWAALYTVIAGGVLALIVGAARGYLREAFRNLSSLLVFWRTSGVKPAPGLTIDDAMGPRLPYGVAIAAGTLAAVVVKLT